MAIDRLGLAPAQLQAASGWRARRMVAPSKLIGANGLRRGADGLIYVAQAFGSQISTVEPVSGEVRILCSADDKVVSPDDVAFDSRGNLFTTELMNDRVSVRRPDGSIEVLAAELPVANGLTVHQDRIFVTEFRDGGRLLELHADGRPPRVLADGLAHPNALSVAPDGHIYFPQLAAGLVSRVPVEGGPLETVADGLAGPVAVKHDGAGGILVINCLDGAVNRIALGSFERSLLALLGPGLDNLEIMPDGEILLSNFADGGIIGLGADGVLRMVVEGAMLGPYGLAAGPGGSLLAADGVSLAEIAPDGSVARPFQLVTPGAPPFMRAVALAADGAFIFTSPSGKLSRYRVGEEALALADDLDEPVGVTVAPDGAILVCEAGAGAILAFDGAAPPRRVASGLDRPTGIAVAPDGTIYASEATAGRVVAIGASGEAETVIDGLAEPQGVALRGADLFVLDRAAGAVHRHDLRSGKSGIVLAGLASDRGLAGRRNVLPGTSEPGFINGRLSVFCGLAVLPDGALCIACEADGSIWQVTEAR